MMAVEMRAEVRADMRSEADRRGAVVRAAESWLGTPYQPCARVKGSGVDCANLLAAAFVEAQLIAPIELGAYPPDWHLHHSEERFLDRMPWFFEQLECTRVPEPGDVALFRYGRCVSHGALLVVHDFVIHALRGVGVVYDEVGQGSALLPRLHSYWTLRSWTSLLPIAEGSVT